MNEEIMTVVEETKKPAMDIVEAAASSSGKGAVVATVLTVAGGVIAVGALIAGGIKVIAEHKSKKELHKVDEDKPVEVTDEMINEVTK